MRAGAGKVVLQSFDCTTILSPRNSDVLTAKSEELELPHFDVLSTRAPMLLDSDTELQPIMHRKAKYIIDI